MIKKLSHRKVLVAMSGGVDSSVAALLLKKQGYEVIGIFMHFWAEGGSKNEGGNKCCSLASFNDARRVANKLRIPLYTVNFDRPFKKLVVDSFLTGYNIGETPNPCIECNRHIKFDLLLKKADELGADFIATGHYAHLAKRNDQYILFRPKDQEKDQTYFLYTLNQNKLKRILFPLSDLTKPQVRAIAKKAGLTVAGKAESQEICFIAEKSHNTFLKKHLRLKSGEIKTMEGKLVGRHQGLPLYTIGQRKGVEIGGTGPFYVAKCDYKTNTLYVVPDNKNKLLYKKTTTVRRINWISIKPKLPLKTRAVIRYRHLPVDCVIMERAGGKISVKFNKPQRAVTPGQSIVFHTGKKVLGGGIINP